MSRLNFRKVRPSLLRDVPAGVKRTWYQCAESEICIDRDGGRALLCILVEWDQRGTLREYVEYRVPGGLRTGTIDTGDSNDDLKHKRSPIMGADTRINRERVRRSIALIRDADLDPTDKREILACLEPG